MGWKSGRVKTCKPVAPHQVFLSHKRLSSLRLPPPHTRGHILTLPPRPSQARPLRPPDAEDRAPLWVSGSAGLFPSGSEWLSAPHWLTSAS